MRYVASFLAAVSLVCGVAHVAGAAEPIDIGSRLELFVDDYLIDRLSGDAQLRLHKPEAKEVAIVTDKPWEGNTCGFYTIFQDGDLYRMYYRATNHDVLIGQSTHPEFTCYAESRDGIHWTKPELGLFEFQGSKQNSIVWDGVGTHAFTPFKDANPDCPPEAKYKALGVTLNVPNSPVPVSRDEHGLYAFQSPDGIHWALMSKVPLKGAFDSQNLAFWDATLGAYRAYWRIFTEGVTDADNWKPAGYRAIRTAVSRDFVEWGDSVDLTYVDSPNEHLYTNAIQPYERAPHILLGFPTRLLNTSQTEPTFMTSRDGRTFHRWDEALIPVTAPEDRDGNRSNYITWGLVRLPHSDREYSVYATEAYFVAGGPHSRVRRFTYRVDGFVSVRASAQGGHLVSKPLLFSGRKLVVNFATSHQGSLAVELQDTKGKPIPGFTLADCLPLNGDEIEKTVAWKGGADVSPLAGKSVRLRFDLKDADVFSFRFGE
jgi:hypothetical protein